MTVSMLCCGVQWCCVSLCVVVPFEEVERSVLRLLGPRIESVWMLLSPVLTFTGQTGASNATHRSDRRGGRGEKGGWKEVRGPE